MNKTSHIFILCAVGALICVGGYIYGAQYVSSLAEKTIANKKEVELSEIRYRHLQSLERAAADTGEEKTRINNLLVQPGGAIKFVTEIESLAASHGLDYNTDVIDVRSVPELDTQNKEQLLVSFSATGRWSNVFKLIKLVETLPYLIQFEKINLVMVGTVQPQSTSAATTGTSTPAVSAEVRTEKTWKVTLMFYAIKVKDTQ